MQSTTTSRLPQFLECVSKEILAGILSLRYPLVLVLIVVSSLFVTAVRTHVYRKQVADFRQAAQDGRQTMTSVKWTWLSIGIGLTFEKAPEPLAMFAFGLEDEMTRSIKYSEFYPDRAGLRKLGATSFRYFSQIDIATVIYFGCSLLALMLVFDSVTAPRERGTLRILLSGPLTRSTLILSKVAAGLLTLAVPLCLAWGVSIAYALAMSGHSFTPEEGIRIGTMVAVSVLYIGTIFALGLLASCWASTSNAALVLSLFAWLLLVLFLPSAAKGISDKVHPIPSFASIEQDGQSILAAVSDKKLTDSLEPYIRLKEPNLDRGQVEERVRAIVAERGLVFQDNLDNKVRNNVALFASLLHISPAWSFLSAATTLAGTGAQDYVKYIREARQFRRAFEKASETQKDVCRKRSGLPWWDSTVENPFSPELWPKFTYERPPLAEELSSIMVDCSWMAGFMALFLILAVAGFVRSEV